MQVEQQKADSQPCHREACAIQECLQKNNYQEERCKDVINQLFKCCETLFKSGGESASCSKKMSKSR
ncbi:mature T-cell proliferation 1 neighbor protein-like protein [Gigaspora margarita]|uniref:Cx9C motif-containing protein 4, mitochondrial n=1 Tax=Gigaspora margarita TaxID=4874 RepID=A0A8H3XC75_GIGMA|nr:mature T-cell proliferation 1 neighbor protein-like protein [Gigaspora margarita]